MTRILSIHSPHAVSEAAAVLQAGGVIVYPTDTVYGLGADATNPQAIQKIFSIKKRSESSALSVILASVDDISLYAYEAKLSKKIAEKFLPGPLTLLLKHKNTLPPKVVSHGELLGIRIPAHAFCLELARIFGKPYTTTSANISGKPAGSTIENILSDLQGVDLFIDAGELTGTSSTIADVSGEELKIIRQGGCDISLGI